MLTHLRLEHAELVRHWFDQLRIIDFSNGHMTIAAKNPAQYYYLSQHCSPQFIESAQRATGMLVSIDFVCESELGEESISHAPELTLNDEFTFDTFVAGSSNKLAYAASVAVAREPGKTYNPLFIYGPVGLGKTHLLQAVCHEIRKNCPEKRIIYVSCETFVNDFIEAVEHSSVHNFRKRYRSADILVIDDVQFLANRDSSQEEFFHTFNALYQANKQIILSSDRPPGEIETLTERLISRFSWGLVAMVDYPSFETRVAIIKKKAKLRNIDIPNEVTDFLARALDTNIREIEGVITKLQGLSMLNQEPITMEMAREAIPKHLALKQEPSLDRIAQVVTEHFHVKVTELQSKKRNKSLTVPRQVCMFIARHLTKHSLEEIGGYFGGRDHSTVLHAIKTTHKLIQENNKLRELIETITRELNGSISLLPTEPLE